MIWKTLWDQNCKFCLFGSDEFSLFSSDKFSPFAGEFRELGTQLIIRREFT